MKLKQQKNTTVTAYLFKAFKKKDKIIDTTEGKFRVDSEGDIFLKINEDFVRCFKI